MKRSRGKNGTKFDIKSFFSLKDFYDEITSIIIVPVMYIWFLLMRLYNPLSEKAISVTSFNRIFGNATLAGIDAQKRANSMLFYNLFFSMFLFFLAYYAVRFFLKYTKLGQNIKVRHRVNSNAVFSEEDNLDLLNSLLICGMGNLLIMEVYAFNNQIPTYYAIQILFVMLVATLLHNILNFLPYDQFKWGLFTGFSISLFINFVLRSLAYESEIVSRFKFGIIFSIVLYVLYLSIVKFQNLEFERLKTAFTPLYFGMICTAVFLELTNVLNQHSIFIIEREFWAKIVYAGLVLIGIILYCLKIKFENDWETICFLGLVIGMASFTQISPLKISAGTELFEQANHGMLVYDFFHSGKTPILESFDGHMLKVSFGGLVYGLLNGQAAVNIDASYFYYSFANVLNSVILFYLLKNIFSKEFSLIAVLFVPLGYIDVYGIVLVFLLYCIKKDSVVGYLMYFVSILVAAIYELPPAVGIGVGSFVVMILIFLPKSIRERRLNDSANKFIKAMCIFVFAVTGVYLIICIVRSINPISRIREIIGIISSNNNWAYSIIGDQSRFVFNLGYFILPAIAVISVIFVLAKLKTEIKHNLAAIIVVTMLIAHFANYSRMLGRHSFAEGSMGYAIQFLVLPLALLFALFVPKFSKWGYVFVVMSLPALVIFATNKNVTFGNPLLNHAISVFNDEGIYYKGSKEKIDRVEYANVMQTHAAVIDMINANIPHDETYMDLSSQTMLYALTNHKKPVYINQSPLHLSGEYTQLTFIEQINNNGSKCNFALLGGTLMALDGVRNEYRYYKVYEYLNAEFVPLCSSSDGYELWVRKEKYDEARERLLRNIAGLPEIEHFAELSHLDDANWTNGVLNDNPTVVLFQNSPNLKSAKSIVTSDGQVVNIYDVMLNGNYQRVTFETQEIAQIVANDSQLTYFAKNLLFSLAGYNLDALPHSYSLGYIPYIWGTYDSKKAYRNAVVCELGSDGELPLELQSVSNYIMLRLYSEANGRSVQLALFSQDGDVIANYTFQTKEGEHLYLVRPSSDTLWGTGVIAQYSVSSENEVSILEAFLLSGD